MRRTVAHHDLVGQPVFAKHVLFKLLRVDALVTREMITHIHQAACQELRRAEALVEVGCGFDALDKLLRNGLSGFVVERKTLQYLRRGQPVLEEDRKSTRLNSSHVA